MDDNPILLLAFKVATLACIAVGGYITTIPDLQRFVVTEHGWMTAELFVTLFAVAQAAPGPNFMVVTLLGYSVGGALGAFLVTCSAILPTVLVAYLVAGPWERHKQARWRIIASRTIAPVAVGMVLATGALLTQSSWGDDWRRLVVTGATVGISLFTRFNPLLPLALAAGLSAAGVL